MRKRLYEIIEVGSADDYVSRAYDLFMICVIVVSLIPLAMKNPGTIWSTVDKICVTIFIIDYIMRLSTADYKYGKFEKKSFLKYPFSVMAIIDLLSILPSFMVVGQGLKSLRLMRMAKALRVFRAFKILRYSKNYNILLVVIRQSKAPLLAVGSLTVVYILAIALVIFSVEPDSFRSFFEAMYWATISITAVGYGDVVTTSAVGRAITMVSALVGVAVIALPSGIVTAAYIEALGKQSYLTMHSDPNQSHVPTEPPEPDNAESD